MFFTLRDCLPQLGGWLRSLQDLEIPITLVCMFGLFIIGHPTWKRYNVIILDVQKNYSTNNSKCAKFTMEN